MHRCTPESLLPCKLSHGNLRAAANVRRGGMFYSSFLAVWFISEYNSERIKFGPYLPPVILKIKLALFMAMHNVSCSDAFIVF